MSNFCCDEEKGECLPRSFPFVIASPCLILANCDVVAMLFAVPARSGEICRSPPRFKAARLALSPLGAARVAAVCAVLRLETRGLERIGAAALVVALGTYCMKFIAMRFAVDSAICG